MKEFELHSERFPLEVAYSYTSRQKAEFISEGDHTLNFVYGHDNHRRKTIYSNQNGVQLEKYFIGLYEKDQSVLTTVGHFGAGYVGASIGIGTGSTSAALVSGGLLNLAVYFTEQAYKGYNGERIDMTGYEMGQKFVSGALNSYAGYTMVNQSAGYVKGFKNKYLFNKPWAGKGASYALQANASTFAYTDRDRYLSMNGRQFLGITGVGFLAGMANYGIYDGSSLAKGTLMDRTHKFLGGVGVSYLDYIANHQIIYGNYYGGPTEYYGYGNKMGIGGVKNIFSWLVLGGN